MFVLNIFTHIMLNYLLFVECKENVKGQKRLKKKYKF